MDAGAAMRSIETPSSSGSLSQASELSDAEPEAGPKANGVRPWFRRVLHWPGTFLLLMMLMFLDAGTLPRGSRAGAVITAFTEGFGPRRTVCRGPLSYLLEAREGTFVLVHSASNWTDDPDDPNIVQIDFWSNRDSVGAWAPTTQTHSVNGWVASRDLSASEWAAAQAALADGLESLGWYDATTTALIRAGGGRVVRLRPEGFVHNAASAILFGLLVYSARPAASRMHRYVTRVARAATGHDTDAPRTTCSGCGYPRHGLPGPVCPECGSMFDGATGSGAAPASTDPSSPLAPSPSPARAS